MSGSCVELCYRGIWIGPTRRAHVSGSYDGLLGKANIYRFTLSGLVIRDPTCCQYVFQADMVAIYRAHMSGSYAGHYYRATRRALYVGLLHRVLLPGYMSGQLSWVGSWIKLLCQAPWPGQYSRVKLSGLACRAPTRCKYVSRDDDNIYLGTTC